MEQPENTILENSPSGVVLYVDHTHLGRHVTGLERITLELFSRDALAPLELTPLTSSGTLDLVYRQNFALPAKMMKDRRSMILCPGFPPSFILSAFGERVIPYIHDLFLLTRPQDLNRRARLYMAPAFRRAVKSLPRFLVNSQYTRDELRRFCRKDAEILLYRPMVRNVFGLDDSGRKTAIASGQGLRLVALGTVEPRKNLRAAAAVLEALRAGGHPDAGLDIIGRPGWGGDVEYLQKIPGVTLHGYLSIERTRALIERADLFINTSNDEGLGLPLLEVQYAGLPVIAPDAPVFREVLGKSGLFIDTDRPVAAAQIIGSAIARKDWDARYRKLAADNLAAWNDMARLDKQNVIEKMRRLLVARS